MIKEHLRYDCNLHTYQYRPPAQHYICKRKLDMPKIPANPCCPECFLHLPNGREVVESMFRIKKPKSKLTAKKPKKANIAEKVENAEKIENNDKPCNDKIDNEESNQEPIQSPENSRDGFEAQLKNLGEEVKTEVEELTKDTSWTQSDQVLLKSLVEVYQGNFCAISKCMKAKSCKQVQIHNNFTFHIYNTKFYFLNICFSRFLHVVVKET